MTDCRYTELAAPWLLGACETGEAVRFELHLDDCAVCRAEVAHLRPGRDALLSGAPAVKPPAALRERVLGETRRQADLFAQVDEPLRLPRWRRTLGPVFAVAAVALLVFAVSNRPPVAPPEPVASTSSSQAGTALSVRKMPALAPGQRYQVWASISGGRPVAVPGARFVVNRDGSGSVLMRLAWPERTKLLVTPERDPQVTVPTSAPVVSATL